MAPPQTILHLRPVSAEKAVGALGELFQLPPFIGEHLPNVQIHTRFPDVRMVSNVAASEEGVDGESELALFKERVAGRINLACQSFLVPIPPLRPQNQPMLSYTPGEGGVLATLAISNIQRLSDSLTLLDSLEACFEVQPREVLLGEGLPEAHRTQLAAHSAMLGGLESALDRLQRLGAEHIADHSRRLKDLTEESTAKYKAREAELEADHAESARRLGERERELEERVSEFETRENRHVRRDLLRRIQAVIDSRKTIELSPKTGEKRKDVRGLLRGLLLAGAILAAVFGYKVVASDEVKWHHIAPLSAGVVMFTSGLIYFIRWSDQWFSRHAQAEFRNMKFSDDILRASWIAEMLFEWKESGESDEAFPPELLSRLSTNLFQNEPWASAEHPAEQIVKLVKDATEIQAGKAGITVKRAPVE